MKQNKIQEALILCQNDLESKKAGLLKHIKVGSKKPGGYELLIDEQADVAAVETAEKSVEKIQKDLANYQKLLGDEGSMEAIQNSMARAMKSISEPEFAARKMTEKMIRTHKGLDVLACENLPEVQALISKKNEMSKKYAPEIAALKERVDKIRNLEAKYS